KPASSRSRSSASVHCPPPVHGRVPTATTRAPSEKSRSRRALDPDAAVTDRASTDSGAPFVTRMVWPSGLRTSAETSRRSWSKGRMSTRSQPSGGPPVSASASSSALPDAAESAPVTEDARSARSRTVSLGLPSGSIASRNVIRPSVRVPVLSVKRISMLPRSSMLIRRLTTTRLRASEERRLEQRAAQQQVEHEDRPREDRGHAHEQVGERAEAALERRHRLALAEAQRDLPELGSRAGLDDHAAARPATNRRAHVADRAQPERNEFGTGLGIGGLRARHRLAGEDRLVRLELARLE